MKHFNSFLTLMLLLLLPVLIYPKTGLQEDGIKGKVKEQRTYKISNKNKILIEKRTYTQNGNRLKFFEYKNDGKVKKITTFQYQGDKLVQSKSSYFYPKNKVVLIKFKQDMKGNLVEADAYLDGDFYMKRVARYDKENQLLEEIIYKSNSEIWFKRFYQYYNGLNVTLELKLPDGRTYLKAFYHYNEKQNKDSANIYVNGQKTAPLVFEYTYWD